MRAWRNSGSGSSTAGGGGGTGAGSGVLGGSGAFGQSFAQPSTKFGTGWISELNPRKGVLTFENGGHDERVLFLASKVIDTNHRSRMYLYILLKAAFNKSVYYHHINISGVLFSKKYT